MQKRHKQLTVQQYIDEQLKRFDFSNGMSICEGSDAYSPKYTLRSILDESMTIESFIKNVDESIVKKLFFDIDTTDKANLYNYWLTKSNKNVDESDKPIITIDDLQKVAKMHNIKQSQYNGCYVFESIYCNEMHDFIKSIATIDNASYKAMSTSLVDEDATFKVSIAIK